MSTLAGEDQTLRNRLVHRIENVNFSLSGHVKLMDAIQKKAFIKLFGSGIKDNIVISGKAVVKNKFIFDNPKIAIWFETISILTLLNMQFELVEIREQKKQMIAANNAIDAIRTSFLKKIGVPSWR